ncbi:MAG: GNAT family N-acetyltransferase [candidate division WS1 bacterium]|jgi:N-acetylglutamate synthase-like GNAT family acetyltransferase|nr:GNAT family N-acetyltransferase [candidate division WS1 bacterium]
MGTALLEAFASSAEKSGADHVYLTTDADHNDGANAFYASNGFDLVTFCTAAGERRMDLYASRLGGVPLPTR